MFENEIDWKSATRLICDILRGSSSLAVQHRSSHMEGVRKGAQSSGWRYEQTQPHQIALDNASTLFSPGHLRDVLERMSVSEIFFAYEATLDLELTPDMDGALSEFSSIDLTLVKLTVGSVALAWLLVSLGSPRDLVLWKMKYHLRKAKLIDSSPRDDARSVTDQRELAQCFKPGDRSLLV
jgi:hypothetical protein